MTQIGEISLALNGDNLPPLTESLTTSPDGKQYKTKHYNLNVIISVDYHVKSQRGVEFRRRATGVLKKYVLRGHAENELRLEQLGQTVRLLERIPHSLYTKRILDVVKSYTKALDMLDDYDHQKLVKPEGEKATYILSYEECLEVIDSMRFGAESALSATKRMIFLREALPTCTRVSPEKRYILP